MKVFLKKTRLKLGLHANFNDDYIKVNLRFSDKLDKLQIATVVSN